MARCARRVHEPAPKMDSIAEMQSGSKGKFGGSLLEISEEVRVSTTGVYSQIL